MSVIVIGRMQANPATVQQLWAERGDDFAAIAAEAKAAGATAHRWAFGDDFAIIIDEWPDAASFEKFFASQQKIGELMQAANVEGPPEFTIVEARQSPDQF